MGKLIAFWSPYAGHAKVTSSLCAIAGALGMYYPELTVAVSHITGGILPLEERLDNWQWEMEKQEGYAKSGVNALALHYMQEMLTPEKIRRCAIPLLMKSLYLYPNEVQETDRDELTLLILTKHLKQGFDLVLLDAGSGYKQAILKVINAAEFVVVVLPPWPAYWEDFLRKESERLKGKRFCILLGGYVGASKYSVNCLGRKKEFSGNLAGMIPMDTGFSDAMADGRTLEFFLKNQQTRKKEEHYEFIIQTKKATEYIKKNIFLL